MATAVAPLVIRCPVCLTAHWARPDTRMTVDVRCTHCKKAWALMRWIAPPAPVDGEVIAKLPVAKSAKQSAGPEDSVPLFMIIIIGALAGWVLQPIIAAEGVDGPNFLAILAGVGFVTWLVTIVLRLCWIDSWQIVVAGILLFELFGFHRYLWGIDHGMTKWAFTFVMLGLGWLPYLMVLNNPGFVTKEGNWLPYDATTYGGSSGSSCSSGGGSSCGGGGCGGGGCGGCGG